MREFETAIHVGRAFLKVRRFASCVELFSFLVKEIPRDDPAFRKAQEFHAYGLVGVRRYDEAIAELSEICRGPTERVAFWPAMALAYSYFHTNQNDKSRGWLNVARNRFAPDHLPLVKVMYPEFVDELSGQSAPTRTTL